MGRNAVFLGFLAVLTMAEFGCSRKNASTNDDNFPTYEQIRGNKQHWHDQVLPHTAQNDYLPRTSSNSAVIRSRYFGAFDFPGDSVVYIVNGRQAKNKKSAETEVKKHASKIDRVSISEVGPDGKRFVEISFSEDDKGDDIVVP